MNLYTIEELIDLNLNDTVAIEYQDNDIHYFLDVEVIQKDKDYIYFTDGLDFPLNDKLEVSSDLAIQDTGDYIFKVYKINS